MARDPNKVGIYQPRTINAYMGLNEDENQSVLLPQHLREATNVFRLGNLTGTRPGLVRDSEYTASVASAAAVQGMYEFRRSRDSARTLVSVVGGVVHTDHTVPNILTKAGSPAVISTGAANLWTFANFQDQLWAAGGASGDSVWTWDGSAGTISDPLASLGIKPQFVFQKFNALFLNGFYDGTSAWNNPLVSRYCDYAADATDPLNWPNSNTIPGQLLGENSGPSSWGAEFSTGFGSFQDNEGDFLLMLTNRRILSFRENPSVTSNANRFVQTDAIANGCVSQRAFIDLGLDQSDAIYVSDQGVHSMALSQNYGNRANTFLSWPIRNTWKTINRSMRNRFCGAYWPEESLVLIAIATGSNTHLDTLLAIDLQDVAQISPDTIRWYKWHLGGGLQTNLLSVARDPEGEPRVYFGGTAGQIANFSRSTYSDLGNGYGIAFRTKDDDYGATAAEKAIGDTNISVMGSGSYKATLTYLADDGRRVLKTALISVSVPGFILDNDAGNFTGAGVLGTGVLGAAQNILRDRIAGEGSGYTLSHRFTHSGVNEPVWIGQVTQDVAYTGISDEATS